MEGGEGTGLARVRALDGVRGVAALTVLAYHIEYILLLPGDIVLRGGFIGVDVFFALSGFLITSQLLARRETSGRLGLGAYAAKRAVRLLPLLWVFLGVSALYEWSLGTPGRDIAWSTATYGLFLPGTLTGPIDFVPTATTGHLWSLVVEVHFYVLIPALVAAVLHRRRPGWLAPAVLVIAIAAVAVARRHLLDGGLSSFDIYTRSTARIDTLLIGAGAALLHHRGAVPEHIRAAAGWLGAALLGLWALTLDPLTRWLPQGGFTAVGIAAAALVLATATDAGPAHHFAHGWLPAIGRVSYGLYVWHLLVILAVDRWLHATPWPLQVGAALAVTALLTMLSWRFVEAPALHALGARMARRAQGGGSQDDQVTGEPTTGPATMGV